MLYEPDDIEPYFAATDVIDWDHEIVLGKARELGAGANDKFTIVRRCFEWVSNRIDHSIDIEAESVPCSASAVLSAGHGLCYAKSHLFAALLRANAIAAGLDYQRLADERWNYVLHGLNTVNLPDHGWIQLDPRGRADGEVQLSGPGDQLVFDDSSPGELNYRLNLAAPLPELVRLLRGARTLASVVDKLPGSVAMG